MIRLCMTLNTVNWLVGIGWSKLSNTHFSNRKEFQMHHIITQWLQIMFNSARTSQLLMLQWAVFDDFTDFYLFMYFFFLFFFLVASGFKGKDGIPEMVKNYLEKKVKLDEFITHKMTLDQVNDAIELLKHGKWYVFKNPFHCSLF